MLWFVLACCGAAAVVDAGPARAPVSRGHIIHEMPASIFYASTVADPRPSTPHRWTSLDAAPAALFRADLGYASQHNNYERLIGPSAITSQIASRFELTIAATRWPPAPANSEPFGAILAAFSPLDSAALFSDHSIERTQGPPFNDLSAQAVLVPSPTSALLGLGSLGTLSVVSTRRRRHAASEYRH